MDRQSLTRIIVRSTFLLVYLALEPAAPQNVPEGKVAFSRYDPQTGAEQIYSINLDGSGLTQLTFDTNSVYNYQPSWSLDGQKIAFIQSTYADQAQVMMMDADGGNLMGISPFGSYAEYPPSWSPDGTKLAYWRYGIRIADTSSIDGSEEELLRRYADNAQWSADGDYIYFNSPWVADSFGVSRGNLFSIHVETGEIQQFTENAIDEQAYGQLSPDETRIVFTMGSYPTNVRLFLTDLSGSFIETLTYGPADLDPRWSNEGTKIVFTKYQSALYSGIYVINPDGTGQYQVTQPPYGHYGDYYPDLFIDTSSAAIQADHTVPLPSKLHLEQNFPNPFNSSTVIAYSMPIRERITLAVYDVTGREVRRLADNIQSEGEHFVVWDGKDDEGTQVPSGIYFYRMEAGRFQTTRKLVFLR